MTVRQIHHTVDNGLAVITLDNPPLNVVSLQMTRTLDETLQAIAEDASVRALVLHGAGEKAFCAGSDISEFEQYMAPQAAIEKKLYAENEMYTRLARFPWPTIAAVHGVAYGGGLELAVCCDMIVADAEARFALPETKLGLFPGSGGTVRVTRRIGPARTKEMVMFGEPIDARRALDWGLVNWIADAGGSLALALELGRKLAQGPRSMRAAKQAIDMAFDLPEQDAIARMLPLIDQAFTTDDCREGVRAFQERRPAKFSAARK